MSSASDDEHQQHLRIVHYTRSQQQIGRRTSCFPKSQLGHAFISRTEHHLLGMISNSFWDNLFTASRLQMQKTRILQEMMICKECGLFRMWDKDVRSVCEHVILFCTLLTCTLVQLHCGGLFCAELEALPCVLPIYR